MLRYPVLCALAAVLLAGGTSLAAPKKISGINYSYPVDSLREGQSYGNEYCYVTLDGKTDVAGERRAVRFGLRESTNQKYYLLGWNVHVATVRAESLLWGSESLRSFQGQGEIAHGKAVKVIAEFAWTPTPSIRAYALSFAYALVSGPGPDHMLLNALFDASSPDSPSPETHLDRIHKLFDDSGIAVRRYLETTQLWTPDPVVNRGYDWAKVNQLRVRSEEHTSELQS